MNRAEVDAIPASGNAALREHAAEPLKTALLLVDLQNMEFKPGARDPKDAYYYDRIKNLVIPNNRRLLETCRKIGIEPIFTVIESLTLDGRDRSLDHKVSGIFAAKGSWEAQVLPDLSPRDNEILIPKTASGIFNSTNFEYVLRNLYVEFLIVTGLITDQCVEGAVRDGCDRGFMVTLIDDACATHTQDRHDASLRALKGYCRLRTTEEIISELQR